MALRTESYQPNPLDLLFNLEVEESTSAPSQVQQLRAIVKQGESRNDEIRAKGDSFHEPIDPDWPEAPPIAPEPPQKRFSALDERQRAIIRQHSQSMALEVLKLKVALEQLTVEDLTPSKLKSLADYFDNDVLGAAQ